MQVYVFSMIKKCSLYYGNALTPGGSMVKLKNTAQPLTSEGRDSSFMIAPRGVNASFTAIFRCRGQCFNWLSM